MSLSMNWLEVGLSVVSNAIFFGLAYGAMKAKVSRLEKDCEQLDAAITALIQNLASHKLDVQTQFVTYEAFKEFKREIVDRQMILDQKIDKVLQALGELRASIK